MRNIFKQVLKINRKILIVWQLYVGYVESVNVNTKTVTWSEQDCYNSNNPYNSSVSKNSFTPSYNAGNFLGYLYFKDEESSCSGTNPIMNNWNPSATLTCKPSGTFIINPESTLDSAKGEITINIQ